MKSIMRRALGAAAVTAWMIASAGCPNDPHGTGGGDTGGSGGGGPVAWQTVYSDKALGGAVLSVWGSSSTDVYVVGGPLGNSGFEAVVQHFDGTTWKKLAPGGADSFWWVSGSGPDDVWMTGEHGRITHWDGKAFQDHPALTTATLWGVWAASPTDAWAVGGTPEGGTAAPNDVVLHWDGTAWSQETLPMMLGRSLNKVWGTSSTDLYAIGEAGTVWHRKGTTWSLETNPATSNLLTVFGCSATDVYAVGGQDVLHSDGSTWTKVDVKLGNSVNGVTCNAKGEVLLVGFGGLKQRLVSGAWINEFTSEPYGDLHGAWADDTGAFWVAGGDFVSSKSAGVARKATIGRFGAGLVPALTP
ncbi:BNR repeat domain protein [Minicystis rosea]|nr:BNR repeat domain protein [Minicystis rosea]